MRFWLYRVQAGNSPAHAAGISLDTTWSAIPLSTQAAITPLIQWLCADTWVGLLGPVVETCVFAGSRAIHRLAKCLVYTLMKYMYVPCSSNQPACALPDVRW